MNRKQIMIILAAFISIMLYTAIGMAQEKGSMAKPGAGYNPVIQYAGFYKQDVLFYRNSPKDDWQRRPRFGSLRRVNCAEAVEQLKTQGMWKGRLNRDGACVRGGEPPVWAMGNRINFDEQHKAQD